MLLMKATIDVKKEADIDQRRALGLRTNLKMEEFHGITRVLRGNRLCQENHYGLELSVIVLVIIKPFDFGMRSLIRSTWAKQLDPEKGRLYFVIGHQSSKNQNYDLIDRMIDIESKRFNDLIQFDYEEDYFRLTIKSIGLIRWTTIYCPLVKNVFKIDADSILNFENLFKYLNSIDLKEEKSDHEKMLESRINRDDHHRNERIMIYDDLFQDFHRRHRNVQPRDMFSIHGNIWRNAPVQRNSTYKFVTSHKDYSQSSYPIYTGSSYLLHGRYLSTYLYWFAIRFGTPALLWEDIFVTGILVQNFARYNIAFEHFQMNGFQFDVMPETIDQCFFNSSIIFNQRIGKENLQTIWKRINNSSTSIDLNHLHRKRLGKSCSLKLPNKFHL
ncbi:potassium channel subfamily t member 1-like protein [Sarcoptes scabiei]|nr:potassium channel subfamily t member 1-like protein [Sarcoptes scabiei]